jgi:hypothetical protein
VVVSDWELGNPTKPVEYDTVILVPSDAFLD